MQSAPTALPKKRKRPEEGAAAAAAATIPGLSRKKLAPPPPTAAPASHAALAAVVVSPAVAAEWGPLGLHAVLLRAVARLGFARPTPIQLRAVPAALAHFKDIIGAAETGSGKTLAFGLPIVHRLLDRRERLGMSTGGDGGKRSSFTRLPALILTPTRELALQVRDHLAALTAGTSVTVIAIVGGLAVEKQTRLLKARPDVVIATPGRLWDIMGTGIGGDFLSELHRLQVRGCMIDDCRCVIDCTGGCR